MVKRSVGCMRQLAMILAVSFMATGAVAVDEGDVEMLDQQCEAARKQALAPIREQRIRACIEQQLRPREECETYYSTYGNVRRSPSGAPTGGYYYDLPPCREWQQARQELLESRSRP